MTDSPFWQTVCLDLDHLEFLQHEPNNRLLSCDQLQKKSKGNIDTRKLISYCLLTDAMQYQCMILYNSIVQNDCITYSNPWPNTYLGTNRYVWSKLQKTQLTYEEFILKILFFHLIHCKLTSFRMHGHKNIP